MRGRRINPFIRAHGAAPGPFMRPRLTGALTGLVAAILTFLAFAPSGIFSSFGVEIDISIVLCFAYGLLSGFIYGSIYRRAANDRKGGWIFGASTGFILWMINPAIWFPWLGLDPVLIGRTGLLVMLMHVVHGAALGLLYPWGHLVCARKSRIYGF